MTKERFGVAELILREVCEMDPDDPEKSDTICIDVSTLKRVIDAHISETDERHGLDSDTRVCFYEQDFYVLSNFSSFNLVGGFYGSPQSDGITFATSEHAYHWHKFQPTDSDLADAILFAPSAHDAFKLAERNKVNRWDRWDEFKVEIMRDILRAKVTQHEYVRRKLLATGDRELVENSWRDDFWGWGPTQDGANMLGKLWMEIRAEIRAKDTPDN